MENSVYLKSIPLVFEDHGNKLLKALYDQQQKSQLCDVSLVVENVSFPAHKAILAAHSSYFQALFDRGKLTDDAGSKACNVTTIHLSSISANTFIPILHFLYTSRLHVFSENVNDLMRTARKLQISTIVQACEHLIAESVTLPSVNDVQKHQSSEVGTVSSQQTQSVLYVDLKSEDDEDFSVPSSTRQQQNVVILNSTADNKDAELSVPVSSYISEQANSSRARIGRTQKKQGFPKKIQQTMSPSEPTLSSGQHGSPQNIATISPASIFGRTTTTQASRNRTPNQVSESLPNMMPVSVDTPGFDPYPFENHLESLGSIFASDPLMIDSFHSVDSSVSSPMNMDKTPLSIKVTQTKAPDSLQVQSVYSMSPKLSSSKSSPSLQTNHKPIAIPKIVNTLFGALPPRSGDTSPSVYTCKECCKYFTNISEAVQHYYTEHNQLQKKKFSQYTRSTLNNRNSHSCPHCGRLFNNKNNLKRHILIKHTTDKRFKCAICGRRYAIRQSLQYHIRSMHGKEYEDVSIGTISSSSPSISTATTSAYQSTSHLISSTTDMAQSVGSSGGSHSTGENLVDLMRVNEYTIGVPSSSTYLNASALIGEKDRLLLEPLSTTGSSEELPTIQRIESIRNVHVHNDVSNISEDIMETNLSTASGSDSRLVKVEPRGVQAASNITPASSTAFPGSTIHSAISLSSPVGGVNLTQALTSMGQTDLNSETLPISGGNPFVLAGSSNLPTILPAFTSGEYRRQSSELSTNIQRIPPRLYRCDTCDRAFSTVQAYTRHRRSCNKHECPICHRGFSQMGNMRRHIKIFHSDQKPFECKVCNKAYGIHQSFRYHMRDKHGITTISKPAEQCETNMTRST